MGRRRNRKRERRKERQSWPLDPIGEPAPWPAPPDEDEWLGIGRRLDDELPVMRLITGQGTGTGKVCGMCREFVEDGEQGRGTCLHPASGVLSPWTVTAACPYFARGRRE
ncbi:MAG: hypothetical protein U5Q44_09700 [Dehalococcoidia bacterium]|nr:hypothetical protein [Dehalococcoidia bacterium]